MSYAEEFVRVAESKCGSSGSGYKSKLGLKSNDSWSAAFVSCCAQECDVLSVIPKVTKCQDIVTLGTSESFSNTGTWVASSSTAYPEVGDIALFVWSSNISNRADKLGIVKSYNKETDSLDVVLGDYGTTGSSNSTVRLITYSRQFSCIKGYFRPAWNKVSSDAVN